jgi:hypothetical protein
VAVLRAIRRGIASAADPEQSAQTLHQALHQGPLTRLETARSYARKTRRQGPLLRKALTVGPIQRTIQLDADGTCTLVDSTSPSATPPAMLLDTTLLTSALRGGWPVRVAN